LVKVLEGLANGDLSIRVLGCYSGTYERIKNALNQTIEKLNKVTQELQDNTKKLHHKSHFISGSNHDISICMSQQRNTINKLTSKMREIHENAQSNSEFIHQSNNFAQNTKNAAKTGETVMHNLIQSISDLSVSSKKIVDIISVIDTIAAQTNLLALNASVEAARAGDAGKGFAVVAGEVRTLSNRTSQAAREIRDLIINNETQIQIG